MKLLFILFLSCFSMGMAIGQTALVSAGGDVQSAGGSVSWSLGQIAVQQYSSNDGSLNEGVQQPYESLTVAVPDGPVVEGLWRLYPNPTSTGIQIESADWQAERAAIILYHLDGRSGAISASASSNGWIDLSSVAAGVYVLQIRVNGEIQLHERIIKY